MTAIIKRMTSSAAGYSAMLMRPAMAPNSGGVTQVPTYALAICTPISACERSAPKRAGVE